MTTESGTTFYTIYPADPMSSLTHGDHFVLVPYQNSTHHVRLTINSCGGDFAVLRWVDKTRTFEPLGDDFLVTGVATGLIWNETENCFVVDAQAVNIHGWEWLIVDESTTVGKGTARLMFQDYGAGTVTCDLTDARQFSSLVVHNGGLGGVVIRSDSIGANAKIYREGVLYTDDIALPAGHTGTFAARVEDEYTLLIMGELWLPNAQRDIDTFLGLLDTPSAYTNDQTKVLRVNVAEDEVEFSPGVFDETTQETVFVKDAVLQLGPLGGTYFIGKRDNRSSLGIGASTGVNLGAHMVFFAEDAGNSSNDMDLRTGVLSQLFFDYSFKTWDFGDNEILGQNGFTINGQIWPAAPGVIGQVLVQAANGQTAWGAAPIGVYDCIIAAASDEVTPISVGATKTTFRAPYGLTLAYVRASLSNAPTGADFIVDVLLDGVSLFSTPITIDAGTKTSVGSATPSVLSTVILPDDGELTVDVLQVGSTLAGAGLKVSLSGIKAA